MNSSCALLAEFHVNLLRILDQLSVLVNLQIVLIDYQNIGKILYRCITIKYPFSHYRTTENAAVTKVCYRLALHAQIIPTQTAYHLCPEFGKPTIYTQE